jgi:hypothetical protein
MNGSQLTAPGRHPPKNSSVASSTPGPPVGSITCESLRRNKPGLGTFDREMRFGFDYQDMLDIVNALRARAEVFARLKSTAPDLSVDVTWLEIGQVAVDAHG